MAKQRVVNTRFWEDNYILSLKPDERLAFLWAITNPASDLCGAYEAALSTIAHQTGLKPKRITEIFERFRADDKMLYSRGWVIVKNFRKHQQGQNPNVKKGVERSLNSCPDWIKETLSKGFGNDSTLLPVGTTCRDNLDLKGEPLGDGENPPPPRGEKPTLESLTVTDELRTWAKDNGISADLDLETEQWRDHHRSAGTKIKDAKASWRKWMRNTLKFSQSKLTTTSNGNGYDPTKDIMHPDYKIEKPRKTFTEAADHVLDNMPDKYEEMKVNWLTMPWVKGYEYEIEEYERSSPRYQRYCETRQTLASASVN